MKLNYNKICYLILHSITLGLLIILSCLFLFTNFIIFTYFSFFITYAFGILLVKKIHQYPLWIPKRNI